MKHDDAPDLFEAILGAPDRDRQPGLAPVVSYQDQDEPEYLEAVDRRAQARVSLTRRGRWHGSWAELDEPDPAPEAGPPLEALLASRWHTAQPVLFPSLFSPRELYPDEIAARRALHDQLKEPGGLREFLKSLRERLEPAFQVGAPGASGDERDIERVMLTWQRDPRGASGPRMRDLWVKSAWLSTHDDDESLRMRISFGREGNEDADGAQRDVRRHRRVEELARVLLPECEAVHGDAGLAGLLADLIGDEVFYTQHIAYWNAPGGGALFHHDAFAEPIEGGQRGVLYTQLSGSTAWLALSIEDLARRVIEFGESLAEGELGWVRAQLFGRGDDWQRFQSLTRRFKRVVRELARPGCGSLGGLVNRGPEFTSFLADAGHASILRPGDVLLLPNHGLERTAMHSVFCASDDPAYGVSMAIRESHPPPPPHRAPRRRTPRRRFKPGPEPDATA